MKSTKEHNLNLLKKDIESRNFRPYYLLYGEESYLIRYYQKLITNAIIKDNINMNLSVFYDKITEFDKILSMADTLPFFSDYRLIVFKNSKLFCTSNDFSKLLPSIPKTTILLFVEDEVDGRNKLFKAVNTSGLSVPLNFQDDASLVNWIIKKFSINDIKIERSLAVFLLEYVGNSLEELNNETDKLVSYCIDSKIVQKEDIIFVCNREFSDQIFSLLELFFSKNITMGLNLYLDLIENKEAPLKILSIITLHFQRLLNTKILIQHNENSYIPKMLELNSAKGQKYVPKYIRQSQLFSLERLKELVENCISVEEAIKTGQIKDILGLESILFSIV